MDFDSFFIQEKTLGQMLDESIAKNPDGEALIYADYGLRRSWKDYGALVDDLARGFMALGIRPGEKVALWATNTPYWVETMFACAKIGAILLTVNTGYRETELEYLLQQSECETLVVGCAHRDFDFFETVDNLVPELRELAGSGRAELDCRFGKLRRVVSMEEKPRPGAYSIAEIIALGQSVDEKEYAARQAAVSPHDVVNMQYTSGTTGFPKGVMLTHVNILNDAYWCTRIQRLGRQDKLCLTVPLFHCFGCVLAALGCVCSGSALVLMSNINPGQSMSVIESERCTALYAVPAVYQAILQHRAFSRTDFSSLRTGIMGGSVCPVPLMRQVIETMHMPEITIAYGMTESSPAMCMTSTDDTFERRVGTAGRPMPGVEVSIRDPETGLECPLGENGEICCRGYNVMKGYYRMPEETAAVIDGEGFLHSGDLGWLDEDGYLHVSGRIKDMIIKGGENVYPREIEEFISTLPGVLDVQVVAVPSRRYGEEVCAFIIPERGSNLTPADIRRHCRGKIAGLKKPRYIHMLDSYPVTTSGKIQKYKLREMAVKLFPQSML
ncbi:MAG: AMP-binding protein [Deltaproteobacteria bacterium]|jgi:fatty-acyl-CoA synthase|nr:AMP-binding protein [Deltaproteobacteria bacterium]